MIGILISLVAIKAAEVHAAMNVLDLRMHIGMFGSDILTLLQSRPHHMHCPGTMNAATKRPSNAWSIVRSMTTATNATSAVHTSSEAAKQIGQVLLTKLSQVLVCVCHHLVDKSVLIIVKAMQPFHNLLQLCVVRNGLPLVLWLLFVPAIIQDAFIVYESKQGKPCCMSRVTAEASMGA